jgi:lipopolysaccharide heptosyltransferase II
VRILIIRLSSLGDIILTSPLVQELRRKYPEAKIDFLVKKEFADIVLQFPWVNDVIILDTAKGRDEIGKINAKLQNTKYDHVLDLHNNLRSRLLRKNLGSKLHVINKRIFKRWLLVKFKKNLLKTDPDIIGRYFETAKELAVNDPGTPATFEKKYPQPQIKKAAICPGAKHWNKRWPQEYYSQIAKDLIAKGYEIEFFGSIAENEYVDVIANQLPSAHSKNLCGKFSLDELPERMGECSLAITNDSGLMHLAAAIGIPVISIFGPTVREFGFFPRGENPIILENNDLDCRPCTTIGLDHCPKGHFKCMKEIETRMIIEKIDLN